MLEMCENLSEFYPKEISKINERMEHFRSVEKFWKNKK